MFGRVETMPAIRVRRRDEAGATFYGRARAQRLVLGVRLVDGALLRLASRSSGMMARLQKRREIISTPRKAV
jgi:hypothetical protein